MDLKVNNNDVKQKKIRVEFIEEEPLYPIYRSYLATIKRFSECVEMYGSTTEANYSNPGNWVYLEVS